MRRSRVQIPEAAQFKTKDAKISSKANKTGDRMKKAKKVNVTRSLFLYRLHGNKNHLKNFVLKNYEKIDSVLNKNSQERLFSSHISRIEKKNYSQFYQDLFVTYHFKNKRNGYFVEFGACDGIRLSNTYYLEKELNWSGILSEPAKIWHKELVKNRKCVVSTSCISPYSGELIDFSETVRPELSTLNIHLQRDLHSSQRIIKEEYKVSTLSLNDLLLQNGAPNEIDFISIDTEGSELEILEQFDFKKYKVQILIVEHNYDKSRKSKIKKFLAKQNYIPTLTKISGPDFWFVQHKN
jgi:FkbM family methyltransferase